MNQIPASSESVGLAKSAVAPLENWPGLVAALFPMLTKQAPRPLGQAKAVKRLLRHQRTHLYFQEGHWVNDPFQATVFGDCLEAAQTCDRYGLTDVELSMYMGNGALDFFSTRLR